MAKHSLAAAVTGNTRTGFVVNEPVVSAFVALWLLTRVGTLVVGRLHWINQDAYDALSNSALGVVSLVVLLVIGVLVRRVVTPLSKLLARESGIALPTITFEGPAEAYAVDRDEPAAAPAAPTGDAEPAADDDPVDIDPAAQDSPDPVSDEAAETPDDNTALSETAQPVAVQTLGH